MSKVKICGLTRLQDIEYVNLYCPDYVGFVFAESRRKVTPEKVCELVQDLSPSIKTVGVFVNEKAERVNEISELCQLDVVQLHGDESPHYCTFIKRPIWKAVRVKDAKSFELVKGYPTEGILMDTYSTSEYGGTGRAFDWQLAKHYETEHKIVLAGGLNSENVMEAIQAIHPYCVDVSSGIETNGQKDPLKIKDFIEMVRLGECVNG